MTVPTQEQLESPQLDLWVDVADTVAKTPVELPTEATWQSWFSTWLSALKPTLSPIQHYEMSLLITTDIGIQQLNATYRHQDKATDVLAFAAQDYTIPGNQTIYQTVPLPLGDVIISIEMAQRQRHQVHYSIVQELAWLAAHGLLHLLGWDHPDDESLQRMLNQQYQLLKLAHLVS